MLKKTISCASFPLLLFCSLPLRGQPDHPHPPTGHHGGPSLYLANMTADQVVPPRVSTATGTGAFSVDKLQENITFDLTFHGLESPPLRGIALYNFSAGGNGEKIQDLCGAGQGACPTGSSGTLKGAFPSKVLTGLRGELASMRVYLEIQGSDGAAEIRGQLEPSRLMVPVRSFVARLAPRHGAGSSGSGTAVVREAHFANGRIEITFHLTVAGTSGPPTAAALVAGTDRLLTPFRNLRRVPAAQAAPGGSLNGRFDVLPGGETREAALLLEAGDSPLGVLVSTSALPDGELFGVLEPPR
jgi:hypothetical protein